MDNCYPYSDPENESKNRPYEHGKFYNGNDSISAKEHLAEGSKGLPYDQGFLRCSLKVNMKDYDISDKVTRERLDKANQGSHAHLED